jgi:hypothetical protein
MIILEPDPLAPASFNAHENLSLSIGKAAVLLGVCISTLRRWHAEAYTRTRLLSNSHEVESGAFV